MNDRSTLSAPNQSFKKFVISQLVLRKRGDLVDTRELCAQRNIAEPSRWHFGNAFNANAAAGYLNDRH
jgi:hypothetical protein